MIFEHNRFSIINPTQHILKHSITGFSYLNPRLPGVSSLGDAMDYLVAHLYPNYQGTVATPGDLPGVATLNDYMIVTDDGDGKSAGYIYSRIDSVNQWIKRYDVDWSFESILAETLLSTRPIYVHKWGVQDRDETGALYTGDLAGQRIFGSDQANEHLTLYANSGDAVGNTGYVQVGDDFRPLTDSARVCGTNTYRWLGVYTNFLYSGTMTISSGSITDSSGAISFGDENLSTTGTLGCGILTASSGSSIGTLTLSDGSITDSGGAISFGDENLSTTGTLGSGTITVSSDLQIASGSITSASGAISFGDEDLNTTGTLQCGALTATQGDIDDIRINANSISITTADTSLLISANGTGIIALQSNITTLNQTVTGTVGITGQLNADNLRLDGNTLSSTNSDGNIILDPNGSGLIELGSAFFPTTHSAWDIGKSGNVWNDLWIDGNLKDGTNTFLISEIMSLRNVMYRAADRLTAVQDGDTLFYDSASGTWLANHPDTEITHSEIGGITTGDAGHTQFAMLAGRAGGQTLQGGTAASELLVLESTSNGTKGTVQTKDDFLPFTNASYSGGWSGTDLGGSSNYFKDIYSKGVHKGLRLENYLLAGLPASSATSIGRLAYVTDEAKPYIDTGAGWIAAGGANKHVEDLAFDGIVTQKDVDVSSNISDARNTIRQLLDNANDFEVMGVTIRATSASNVRIITTVPLTAGTYRLVVME